LAETSVLAAKTFLSGPTWKRQSQIQEQYAQYRYTVIKTNTYPDPNRYRRRCPDPNARIRKFIHYLATTYCPN